MNTYQDIIKINADVRGGKACIRDLRITVYDVFGWLASGMSQVEILEDFPELKHEDILACFAYIANKEKHTLYVD